MPSDRQPWCLISFDQGNSSEYEGLQSYRLRAGCLCGRSLIVRLLHRHFLRMDWLGDGWFLGRLGPRDIVPGFGSLIHLLWELDHSRFEDWRLRVDAMDQK